MKFIAVDRRVQAVVSRPARGAWVEMRIVGGGRGANLVAPRKGRVG